MPFDAFKSSNDSIQVKTESFKDKGELGGTAESELNKVQEELNRIMDKMKDPLNKKELKLATLAVERELEGGIPDDFRYYYEKTDDWSEATKLITGDILGTVQDFVTNRLATVIDVVDAESWTDNLDKGEVGDVLKTLDPTITKSEIEKLYARWNGKGGLLEEGGKTMASGMGADRIKEQLKEQGVEF